MKGYVASKNLSFKFNDVKYLVEEALDQVSAQKWYNCCSHFKTIEQKYWSFDIAVINEIATIVSQVDSSDSGTGTEDKLETYDDDTEGDEPMFMTVTLKLTSRRKHGG